MFEKMKAHVKKHQNAYAAGGAAAVVGVVLLYLNTLVSDDRYPYGTSYNDPERVKTNIDIINLDGEQAKKVLIALGRAGVDELDILEAMMVVEEVEAAK